MNFDLEKITDMLIGYAPKVLGALATLIIGFWIAGKVTSILKKGMAKRNLDKSVRSFIASLVSVGIKILVLLSVASMFGFETTSFVAILGALVFAIGLALQGSLGHFASGIMILSFKPYRVSDLVELDGKIGVVEEIGIFNTTLLTPDNKTVIIPNGVVTSGTITNISGQGQIRVDMTFGIGYTDDIDQARKVIQEVADSNPMVLKSPPIDIFVSELADSSVNFAVRPWCDSANYWDVYFFMHEQIKKAFDAKGISIPYPQMDVHLPKD